MRPAIFSAFPHELKQIVKNFKITREVESPFKIFSAEHPLHEVILVETGMGSHNAEAAFEYVLAKFSPDFVVSAGFGGALYDGAAVGDLIYGSKFFLIDEKVEDTIELSDAARIFSRLSGTVSMREGTILTLQRWMKKSEIKQIVPRLPLPVCDMETFPLAKLSMRKGLPFFAIRSITDRADEELSLELLDISDESGQYRLSRALRLILSRPKLISEVAKLGRNSRIASNRLWHAVKNLVEIL
jgi:nucleoside phosphorylase